MRRFLVFFIIFSLLLSVPAHAEKTPEGDELNLSAPCAALMEKETGQLLYEKDSHARLFPASITKIMVMLLITERLESGELSADDIVTASARAASFGGSCVYLEEGEQMSVRDMLKCISVVSANDCAVAMAEHISGTEARFVELMNRRAQSLELSDTHFTNCTGLVDDGNHYTSAYDVALMSAALIRHDLIKEYTTIWMDSIRNGEFELSNTNKLVYYYPGCTGLKTGFTSTAMYCLSATAERDGTEYIAVVMHCESADARNRDARTLLDHAFASYALCPLDNGEALPCPEIRLGKSKTLSLEYGGCRYAVVPRSSSTAEYTVELPEVVNAPVYAGDTIGTVIVSIGAEEISRVPIVAAETVPRLGWLGLMGLLAGSLLGL